MRPRCAVLLPSADLIEKSNIELFTTQTSIRGASKKEHGLASVYEAYADGVGCTHQWLCGGEGDRSEEGTPVSERDELECERKPHEDHEPGGVLVEPAKVEGNLQHKGGGGGGARRGGKTSSYRPH